MNYVLNSPPLKFAKMNAPLLTRGARLAGFAGIAAIAVLSLLPGAERPHTGLPGQAEHFMAYACTGFALSVGYRRLRERLIFWAALSAASGVFEILQQWIPGRGCEIEDAVVSTLGATAGLVLGAVAVARLYAGLPAEYPKQQGECGAE
jgi:VanZ like family